MSVIVSMVIWLFGYLVIKDFDVFLLYVYII